MRVLLIEGDRITRESITLMLHVEYFSVAATNSGEEGFHYANSYTYDIVLLDTDAAELSGYEVLRKLRLSKINIPVIFISHDTNIQNKIRRFNLGADDYLVKPFHKDELIARIQAILRRSQQMLDLTIEFGEGFIFNAEQHFLYYGTQQIKMTTKETQLLELLLRRKGVITREMILDHLYGGRDEPALKIVDVFLCRIRKVLKKYCGHDNTIKTIWGRGYIITNGSGNSKNNTENITISGGGRIE